MPNRDIIVIGTSAGGVEALTQLVKRLPADLPAAIFVAIHFPAQSTSVLPAILTRLGSLPAIHPNDQDPIRSSVIYIAPPDYHLLLLPRQIRLSRGPRENGHRPAIDTMFRSAARTHGKRVIGVILTGALDDGTAGLSVIKARGGVALVQDPEEALFDSMPLSAIANVAVDQVLPLAQLAATLVQLVKECAENPPKEQAMPDEIANEAEIVAQDKAALEQGERPGSASILTCPECGGVLWELNNSNLLRYRCHVGHAYSIDSLLSEQANFVESALWAANRALEEKAALCRRMAAQARQQDRPLSEAQFLRRAEETKQQAAILRQIALQTTDQKQEEETAQPNGGYFAIGD
jgi:two-component system, chemotaxis family, protein-glutamate methylesterase/glutaminase